MKKILTLLLVFPFLSLAQVGINTTVPKAALDVESTNNGMLIPRVQLTSTLDATTVVNPNTGPLETSTLVYNIAAAGTVPNNVVAGFYYWNGSQWIAIVGNNDKWSLTGNTGTNPSTSAFGTPIIAGENFIGTTDDNDLVFGTNNIERMRIRESTGQIRIGNSPFTNSRLTMYTDDLITADFFNTSPLFNTAIRVISQNGTGAEISGRNTGARITAFDTNSTSTALQAEAIGGGTSSFLNTRIAGKFMARGGTNNYAIVVGAPDGLVGFGTESPTNRLHIENATAGALRIVDGTQANGRVLTSNATGVATWQNPSSLGNYWSLTGNSAITTPATPATYGTSTIAATENFIGTTNAQAFVVGTNNIERMRVLPTGNVGIGLATAPAKLTVFGSFLSPTFPNTTTNGMLRIGNNNEGLDIGKAGAAGNFASWLQSGFSGIAEPLSLQPLGGNVGVGTTNPTSNLEIESGGVTELKLSSRAAFGATRFSMYSDKTLANEWRPAYIETADNGSFTGRLDFYTNGTGLANRLGSLRAMSIANGNVGIATTNPTLAKLQIEGMIGNTSAIFRGSAISQGISMVADWPGIYFNSYFNGGIRAMAGSGFPSIINTDQSNGSLFFQTTDVPITTSNALIPSMPVRMTIAGNGNVGIGTVGAPSNLLHVNGSSAGAVRIVDGTQATNRVLTSDATGVATWRESALTGVQGNLVGAGGGISIPYTQTVGFLQTGSSITLPPGRYVVNVTMLLSVFPATTPANSSFWLRTAFSDFNTANPPRTADTVGSYYVSGNLPGSSYFSILSGSVIINNTSGGNKTYYYVAGEALTNNTTQSLLNYSGWGEDSIVAYRIN